MPSYRLRFAPSPTGGLHIGGLRTAIYAYLYAKKHHGDFILRIEDTDQERYVEGAEAYILNALKWCGIKCDEGPGDVGGLVGPYRQSQRKSIYAKYAKQLVENGNAYYAFDTLQDLETLKQSDQTLGLNTYNFRTRQTMRNSLTLSEDETKQLLETMPYVVRLKNEAGKKIVVPDTLRGDITFDTNQLDDKILLKSNGFPTYHLAVVVDDYLMKISHIFRGEEWLPSAPIHVMLWEMLGWKDSMPVWAHLPLILNPEGKGKLSKRKLYELDIPIFPLTWQDATLNQPQQGFKELGFLPDAFVNTLALLGWQPKSTDEIFTLEQLTQLFDIANVQKSPAIFDYTKARWINHQHLQQVDEQLLVSYLSQELSFRQIVPFSSEVMLVIISLVKERCHTLLDIWENSFFFFEQPRQYDWDALRKNWTKKGVADYFDSLGRVWAAQPFESAEQAEQSFKELADQYPNLKMGTLMLTFRLILVGKKMGPSIFQIAKIIGPQQTCQRISHCVVSLSE